MPNILFASNNKAHWPLSASTTQSGSFDANRVPYALHLASEEVISSPTFIPTSGDVTWSHLRLYFNTQHNTGITSILTAFGINGDILFDVTKKFNQNNLYIHVLKIYRVGGDVVADQSFPMNINQINSVDVRYEETGSVIKADLYINGGLAASVTYAGNHSWGGPAHITVGASFAQDGSFMQISEIIIADGDTRNARLDLLRPVASGGETDWVGTAASLADDDPSSGMTSIAANERQTVTISAYSGAANISTVVIATQALVGANAPQNMRHTVRMATVNYDSSGDLPLGDTLGYGLTDFQINPATSLPWVGGDMASLEMGFISKV